MNARVRRGSRRYGCRSRVVCRRLLWCLLAPLLPLFAWPSAGALSGGVVDAGRVEAELISELAAVAPGETFLVALKQKIDPHWHTYWRNPGDSGQAPAVSWQLPEGWSAGELQFPFPQRIPYGPLMNFGYEGEALFPMELRAPENLAGDSVTLVAKADWLVCEEICIPEEAQLALELEVAAVSRPDPARAADFALARERLPRKGVFDAVMRVTRDGGDITGFVLELASPMLSGSRLGKVSYFPYREGVISNPAEQKFRLSDAGLTLELAPGYDATDEPGSLDGLVVMETASSSLSTTAYEVRPKPVSGGVAAATYGLSAALLGALLGGLILNLMPCVFPVLSIKLLSLVGQAGEAPGLMRLHGLVYLAGVLLTFAGIGITLLLLRGAGAQLGWGFQLQSPLVVTLLIYLLFLVGLSLSGFMLLGAGLMGVGSGWSSGTGLLGSFATGALAVFVAAPCTAPFMGPALGFAVTQPAALALAVFLMLGLGFALPYMLLTFAPGLLKLLPRPGVWMERLKEFFAFPMYGAAVWLLWVLSRQTGPDGVLLAGVGLVLLTFAVWLLKSAAGAGRLSRYLLNLLALAAVLGALALPALAPAPGTETAATGRSGAGPSWRKWSPEAQAKARATGPVFVNFTAAWCITCKVNEAVALNSARVAAAFAEHGVTYLKGDWTLEDPAITEALAEFDRNGVPLYLVHADVGTQSTVLPQVLTEELVINAIETAAAGY